MCYFSPAVKNYLSLSALKEIGFLFGVKVESYLVSKASVLRCF